MMDYLDGEGGVNRWCIWTTRKTHPRMSRAVPSGRREGMFPGSYFEIFGRSDRVGCILNLGHSFDAISVSLDLLVCRHARLAPWKIQLLAGS